jgi:putative phosphoesterase
MKLMRFPAVGTSPFGGVRTPDEKEVGKMKIAVISDTHDHLGNLERALKEINGQSPDALLHCGDLCSPFVIDRLAKFNGPVHIVFGNNEGDQFTIEMVSRRFPNIRLHGEVGFVDTDMGKIAFTHRLEFAKGLACTGEYCAVFYGHTHRRKSEKIGDTPLINPGELMGLFESPGWILFDTSIGSEKHFNLT